MQIAVIRELLKDSKYATLSAPLLQELKLAEVMISAYQQCGRVKMASGSGAGGVGLVTSTPTPTPTPPPVMEPPVMPVVEPAPVIEPTPVIEVPPGETPMVGGGVGWGVVIGLATATIEWGLHKAFAPTPSGTPVTYDDLKQIMQKIDTDFSAVKQAAADQQQAAEAAKATKTQPTPQTSVDTDVDKDEKPDDEEPRICDPKDKTCTPVPIPRKGGTSKFTKRHNRCADAVTVAAFKGKDICINGKAFDAMDSEGALWEIKAHAWSYADIYKNPAMALRISKEIASELYEELKIATKCGKEFKVGVRDAGLKQAIKQHLPGLTIEVLKC